jgi:hypothetical protein
MEGSSSTLSRVPVPPPRTSMLATDGSSNTIAVTPDASLASSAWPTATPATSVMRFRSVMWRMLSRNTGAGWSARERYAAVVGTADKHQ